MTWRYDQASHCEQMSPSVLWSQVFVNTLAELINGRRHLVARAGQTLNCSHHSLYWWSFDYFSWSVVNTKTRKVIHIKEDESWSNIELLWSHPVLVIAHLFSQFCCWLVDIETDKVDLFLHKGYLFNELWLGVHYLKQNQLWDFVLNSFQHFSFSVN